MDRLYSSAIVLLGGLGQDAERLLYLEFPQQPVGVQSVNDRFVGVVVGRQRVEPADVPDVGVQRHAVFGARSEDPAEPGVPDSPVDGTPSDVGLGALVGSDFFPSSP